jgi:hypothetical protein
MIIITLNPVRDACFVIDFVLRPIDLNMGLGASDALWHGISEIAWSKHYENCQPVILNRGKEF